MSRKIRHCEKCNQYSMAQVCPECGEGTLIAGPMRFSPEDRMGHYRRLAKRDQIKKGEQSQQ